MSLPTITPSSWRLACGGFRLTQARWPRLKRLWATRTSAPTRCFIVTICSSNKQPPRRTPGQSYRRGHGGKRANAASLSCRLESVDASKCSHNWLESCRRDILMPFINGRDYINPTFGRAIELARMSEVEQRAAEPQHGPAHKGRHGGSGDSYDPATTPEGVANQIYNETAGLRTTDQRGNGPGSDWDLQQARFAMA